MKSKLLALCMAFTMIIGMATAVHAAGTPLVRATEKADLELTDVDMKSFMGMAPGDSRVEKIVVRNDYNTPLNFYIREETLQTLEETNKSSGGAYKLDLRTGSGDYDSAASLLSKLAGGYDTQGNGSEDGLAEIDELDSDMGVLFATLEPGESTNLYLKLEIFGEGNTRIEYANAIGKIALGFAIETPSHSNEIIKYVKTGDNYKYVIYLGVLVVAIVLIAVAIKRRKRVAE